MKSFLISTILSVFFLFQSVYSQNYERLSIIQYKLANGLTVILNPDPTQNNVFGGVGVKAGSKNDPKDMTGIAHYLEHMLFKGTDKLGTSDFRTEKAYLDRISLLYEELAQATDEEERKGIHKKINEASNEAGKLAIPTEFDKLVRSIGGSGLNAFTGEEITFFFNAFPSNQMEKWLDLYSHRFKNPVFRLFQSELEVVYEEKNMYSDNFITAIFELFMKNFYKSHPYGQQTTIGTTEHLKNPSLMKMYHFYNTYYVANNMVLVLSGNFNVDEATRLIEDNFGGLRRGEIPEYPVYAEKPFAGRELIEARLSPVKLGLMGFRTVPNNHKDEIALDVCEKILSNNGETGLLNKLVLDNKLMFAGALPMGRNNDYGGAYIIIIPKVVGQSLTKAENLVVGCLADLKNGNFSDGLIEACKNELYTEFLSNLEDPQMRTVYLAQAFTQNKNIDEFLNYPERVKKITRDEILEAAKTYYTDNYLILHSKMGFPKKETLEKPGYDPVKPNENAVSVYAEEFQNKKASEPESHFVSFAEDFTTSVVKENVVLYHNINPYNDIYSLVIKIGKGHDKDINLKYAAQLMNYAGTESRSMMEFKTAFHELGTTYAFSCDESYVYIEMEGLESNFELALQLLNELVQNPTIDKEKIKLIVSEEKTTRKMEDKEPADVGQALVQYIRKGEKSSYLDRLSLHAIKKLKPQKLIPVFKDAMTYGAEIHYCGKLLNPDQALTVIKKNFIFPEKLKPAGKPVFIPDATITENTIYFINDKKAVQSQIYFIINGETFNIEDAAYYDAFNEYFGGGFSGLVVQEIREYRSMAYATGATLRTPPLSGKDNIFIGYIGTQADKTSEALDVFMGLLRNMPVKEERLDILKTSLVQETYSSRPDFRDLTETVVGWKLQGFEDDPGKYKVEKFKNLTFSNILQLYEKELKTKPLAICIVGDASRLDMEHIATYGKIVNVKKKKLYTK